MLRWHTLAASCCTALLILSTPAQALDLSYSAPEPSIKPAPAPQTALGPEKKPPSRRWCGQKPKTKPVFALIWNVIIPAAAVRAPSRIRPLITARILAR